VRDRRRRHAAARRQLPDGHPALPAYPLQTL
jgi:hypothetical protein